MALALNQIVWSEPIVPLAPDPAWEAEVKRRGGRVFEVDRRVASNPWLREACFAAVSYRPSEIPERLYRIGSMVTAQENSCRYCYGANRALMKVLGYSEAFIQAIERDLHLAELDERDRAFIAFCRDLARSKPRPSGAARDALLALGFTRRAVHEMAFAISMACFFNRVTTLMACPPELGMEALANGPLGRLVGSLAPLTARLGSLARRKPVETPLDAAALAGSRFGAVLTPLAGLAAARVMKSALEGAFASSVLRPIPKAMIFAVIARALNCSNCESTACGLLSDQGMGNSEIASALADLQSERLAAGEAGLLTWARGTVHYDTGEIQRETRALAAAIGNAAVLEAIGVAALANATARMAMLIA